MLHDDAALSDAWVVRKWCVDVEFVRQDLIQVGTDNEGAKAGITFWLRWWESKRCLVLPFVQKTPCIFSWADVLRKRSLTDVVPGRFHL